MSGNIFIISAPSGSGKSTLTNELRRVVPDLEFSISYTTRPPRGSEQSGREYFFISRDEFERMILDHEFLEWAEVFGNYYGTAKRFLREAAARGRDLLLDIDVQGAAQVKQKAPDAISIFVLPPSREELERRLRRRAEADDNLRRQLLGDNARPFNTESIIQRRLQTASREIENFCQYDYILVNDRLEESIDILKSIVEAERIKRSPAAAGAPTSKDLLILAAAERALRPRMLPQVEAVLATFDLSRFPSVSE
jgi:guanylate kinase